MYSKAMKGQYMGNFIMSSRSAGYVQYAVSYSQGSLKARKVKSSAYGNSPIYDDETLSFQVTLKGFV